MPNKSFFSELHDEGTRNPPIKAGMGKIGAMHLIAK